MMYCDTIKANYKMNFPFSDLQNTDIFVSIYKINMEENL